MLLACSLVFRSIVVCIDEYCAYAAIVIRADCGCMLRYYTSFPIKYDILSKPKASSKQRESADLEQKIKNYGEYNGALYRVVAKYDVHNITGCVLHNSAMRTRNMFCSQIC